MIREVTGAALAGKFSKFNHILSPKDMIYEAIDNKRLITKQAKLSLQIGKNCLSKGILANRY